MTAKEAKELLKKAPMLEEPSKVNRTLTQRQVTEIITKGIATKPDDEILSHLYEKRVYQAIRNQIKPRF